MCALGSYKHVCAVACLSSGCVWQAHFGMLLGWWFVVEALLFVGSQPLSVPAGAQLLPWFGFWVVLFEVVLCMHVWRELGSDAAAVIGRAQTTLLRYKTAASTPTWLAG